MSDFYITLPSHSNKIEFPNNTSNNFKIRLPHPLRLDGSGWKVGLSSITLPDTKVPLLVERVDSDGNPTVLFKVAWIRLDGRGGHNAGSAMFDVNDLDKVFSNVTGVGFMSSMITFFEQRRIYNDFGPKFGARYFHTFTSGSTRRTYVKLELEDNELVINNDNVFRDTRYGSDRPAFGVNEDVAVKMGLIVFNDKQNRYQLGPNIKQEFENDIIPTLTRSNADLTDANGYPLFWKVHQGFLMLGIFCNWRLINLEEAFTALFGAASRSLFVYSDVGASGVVGNQVTDLIREVNFVRKGVGSLYFEPLHIQYIPVRKDTIDIIETQVAETDSTLTKFGPGNTIVTLHFKKA